MNKTHLFKESLHPWLLAARPRTLPAAISPVIIGIGISIGLGQFHLGAAIATLFCAVMIQISANYINDVVDFSKGHDQSDRLGPLRVTQAGLLTPRQVWLGGFTAIFLAGLGGIYLALRGGWPVYLIGVACIIAGLSYSAGPYPLVNNGLADSFVLIFFGFIAVVGTVYVLALETPPVAWFGGLAAGVLTVNILVVNNIRDIASDRRAGRKNIPVLYGIKGGEIEYLAMLAIAFAIPLMIHWIADKPLWILLTYLSLPKAMRVYRDLKQTPGGRALNKTLADTAGVLFLYSLLMAAGFILPRLFATGSIF